QRIHKAELTRPLHRHHRSPCNTIRESRHGNYAKVPQGEKENCSAATLHRRPMHGEKISAGDQANWAPAGDRAIAKRRRFVM
ncbi:MAG: hypothetical protein ACK4RV_17790, partial [Caulobacter sp.]